jgi:nucleoside-diphosphate-sugar epimerase
MQADLDAPHSFTYVPDVARTLVTLAADDRAWGRAWHVPTAPAVSLREIATRMAAIAGVRDRGVLVPPQLLVRALGLAVPFVRELGEVRHQFTRPFVLDSRAAQETFGLAPTPLEEGLAAHVHWWAQRQDVECASVRANQCHSARALRASSRARNQRSARRSRPSAARESGERVRTR